MSALVLCGPCEMGDHDRHDGSHHGHRCPCLGGCEPQPNPLLDALLESIERARADRKAATRAGQGEGAGGGGR